MKQRFSFFIRSVVCAASVLPIGLHAETLQEIYLQARQNDHKFQASKADLAAGQENKNLGRAALLPRITANAGWSETSGTDNLSDSDYDQRTQNYGIALQQNLVNITEWYNYQRGKSLADLAEAQFAKSQQDLILRTANAYFDALKAVDNAATAKAEEQALSHQLEQTRQRFEVGLTAITEVHEAQAAYDSSTAFRLEADGNLGIAFEALEVLTGKSYSSLTPLKNDFPVKAPAPLVREPWEELAIANNVQLKIAGFQKQSAEAAAKAAKSGHLPTLVGEVNYGNQRQDLYQNPAVGDSDRDGLTVGLKLSVPIYSGGGISATRRQTAGQALSAKELYLQTQRDVVQATRASHLSVLTSAATLKARKQAITSSRSALEATQAGYDVGTRDLVDVLNAQRNLYVAQRNYYDALYSYIIATLQLKQAAGVLAEKDVVEIDAWLDRTRSVDYSRG